MAFLPFIHTVRRRAMDGAVSTLLAAAPRLSDATLARLGGAIGLAATATIPLRMRLQTNLDLALGAHEAAPGTVDKYLRRFGLMAELQSRIYARTLAGVDLSPHLTIGESIAHLDEAVKHGRGVLLCGPHLFEHEIGGGLVGRRHRVVALAREASNPSRQAIKDRWYRSLGMETVRRPRSSSALRDLRACLAVLESGAVLGITPDLIAPPEEGVPVTLFGRTMHVRPGIATLAMMSGAPLVTIFAREVEGGRREIYFMPPRFVARPAGVKGKSPLVEQLIRDAMQTWFTEFEEYVRRHTAEWMFWLDKRWTQAIRSTPHDAKGTT